jgi:hypothetical protein
LDKKFLYINGSSVSAGGGFEEYQYKKQIRDKYFSKGITLPEKQVECTYGYHLSKKLNLNLINDAKSGLGIDGMIRRTFNWIVRNRKDVKNTLFVLEPPVGIRLDWYVKDWKDFAILNASKDENGNYPFTLVKNWFIDNINEQNEWNEKYKTEIEGYLNNFYDEDEFRRIENSRLLFFVSYLNQLNIDYYITLPFISENYIRHDLNKIIPEDRNINSFLNTSTLWRYCEDNKLLISDEIEDLDSHIGYLGAQKVADELYKMFV